MKPTAAQLKNLEVLVSARAPELLGTVRYLGKAIRDLSRVTLDELLKLSLEDIARESFQSVTHHDVLLDDLDALCRERLAKVDDSLAGAKLVAIRRRIEELKYLEIRRRIERFLGLVICSLPLVRLSIFLFPGVLI